MPNWGPLMCLHLTTPTCPLAWGTGVLRVCPQLSMKPPCHHITSSAGPLGSWGQCRLATETGPGLPVGTLVQLWRRSWDASRREICLGAGCKVKSGGNTIREVPRPWRLRAMRALQLVFWVNHQVTPGRLACEGPGPAAHVPSCKHGFLILTSINFQYKCLLLRQSSGLDREVFKPTCVHLKTAHAKHDHRWRLNEQNL